MREVVQNYIKKKKDEAKKSLAVSLDLYEKVYSDSNLYSNEFPFSEWKGENKNELVYYKKLYVSLTDEEYEALVKLPKKSKASEMPKFFYTVGVIIMIIGFILGICLSNVPEESYYSDEESFSFTLCLIYWVSGFIAGLFTLGFGKIIELLDDIKNKQ